MSNDYEVMGVYSHSTKYQYKLGERGSRYRHGTFWFVRKRNEELYEVRPLNANHIPTGVCKLVSKEDFLLYYTPELSYYQDNTLPCLETLQKKVRLGRRYFNLGQLDRAEEVFCGAVLLQDDNVEGNLGLSQVYAEQQEYTKLRRMLDKLLNIDEVFREEQRHRFNEFGINLRKKKLFDDAIRFYTKALEVHEEDENLHFNIARAYHCKGLGRPCCDHLNRALELNPGMAEAQSFLKLIQTETANTQKLLENVEKRAHAQARDDDMTEDKRSRSSRPIKLEF